MTAWIIGEVKNSGLQRSLTAEYLVDETHHADKIAAYAYVHFYCLVLRDACAYFVLLQAALCCLAKFIHICDADGSIAQFYPQDWAKANHAMFSIGPYYCTAALAVFIIAGLYGIGMCFHNFEGFATIFDLGFNHYSESYGTILVLLSALLLVVGIVAFAYAFISSLAKRHIHLLGQKV